MANKQTAVEWLMEQWEENPTSLWYADFDKAKAMEKEQIIKAYTKGCIGEFYELNAIYAEKYYNESYDNN
jgi:hypothetical protein